MVIDFYYRPKTKLRTGNVFTRMCQEFCPQGRGGIQPPPRADTPWQADTPLRHADTPLPLSRHHPRDGYCSGWYASYCNAFLLPPANRVCGKVIFLQVCVILSTWGGVYPIMQWPALYKQLHWCWVSVGVEAAYR